MYLLCSTTIPIMLKLYLLIVAGPYYYMYVLWTLGKSALHNNIINIDQGELLPTSGTKQLSTRDRSHLTQELSCSLGRTQPFGIGWARQLLLSCAGEKGFLHLDLPPPYQIGQRWGAKYAKKPRRDCAGEEVVACCELLLAVWVSTPSTVSLRLIVAIMTVTPHGRV